MKSNITAFDKSLEYKEKVEPIMNDLKKVCNELRLPFFAVICVKNSKSGSDYESEMLSAYPNDIELKNDILPNLVNVFNGFDTIPHQEIDEIEYN